MAELLSDELWAIIAPHLPKRRRREKSRGGFVVGNLERENEKQTNMLT